MNKNETIISKIIGEIGSAIELLLELVAQNFQLEKVRTAKNKANLLAASCEAQHSITGVTFLLLDN